MPRGGHFAAHEEPGLLAGDLRSSLPTCADRRRRALLGGQGGGGAGAPRKIRAHRESMTSTAKRSDTAADLAFYVKDDGVRGSTSSVPWNKVTNGVTLSVQRPQRAHEGHSMIFSTGVKIKRTCSDAKIHPATAVWLGLRVTS